MKKFLKVALIVLGSLLVLALFSILFVKVGSVVAHYVRTVVMEAPAAEQDAPAAEPAASEDLAKPAAPSEVDQALAPASEAMVKTIAQVGGGEEVIRNWKDESSGAVKLPILPSTESLKGALMKDGKTLFLVAVSSDKGSLTLGGKEFLSDKGFVSVFSTTDPEVATLVTGWNGTATDPSQRHYNVWSEIYAVSSDTDIDVVGERLLAEWMVDQGKDFGFLIKMDGTVLKMKNAEAVKFNEENKPLFPKQLPEGAVPFIMTVSQVGSGGDIISNWKNPEAGYVTFPSVDENNWEGIITNGDKPVYLLMVSSDSATITYKGNERVEKSGFVAAFITSESEAIKLTTGFNKDNGHYNVWVEKYIIPSDEDADTILKEYLAQWKIDQGKTIAFGFLTDGSFYEIK